VSKILIIGPAYPLRGGLATYNERLANEFKALGHECDILSFSLQYPAVLFPGKTQYSTDPPPQGLRILSRINSINPVNWIRTGMEIQKAGYDMIIFRYWMSFMAPAFGTIARIIRKNKHTRILAITDNISPHEKRFFDAKLTQYFLSACDGFLTMSQSVLIQLNQVSKDKPARYVPHPMYDMFGEQVGKSEARKRLGLNTDINYLLFFGFIRKYKGLHLLLDAFADERLRSLPLKLIVAGEFYEDPKPYLEQINALKLDDYVIMSNDFIPNSEVALHFCAADAVIQTYLNATQSGVTQIAYYYNKPMIVTNVGGLAELVPHEHVGYVVHPDKQNIADAILSFYNGNKEDEFVKNIITEKEKFTWRHLCNTLLSLAD
jgi:glycosyltransferase involved in cell wall biosynthesis